MNDTELDRLLDTWDAPAPPPSLRQRLRARVPRPEPRNFARPLRWVLLMVVASATLAIGTQFRVENPWGFPIVRALNWLYEDFVEGLEAWQVRGITNRVRESDPKVYVYGQLAAPLQYGPGARMDVQVPGDGVYSIIAYPMPRIDGNGRPTGWVEAGHIHGAVIEFQAGGKQVRIECNQPIVDADRPIFAMRRP